MVLDLWLHAWLLAALLAPVDAVVIEVPVTDVTWATDAVDSCNEALDTDRCRLADGAVPHSAWFVTVVWTDASKLRGRIELRPPGGEDARSRTREVEFSPKDALEKRYRAVGIIIAAQIIARVTEPPAPKPEPRLQPIAAPVPSLPTVPHWGLDLGILAGPGLDRGPARYGWMLRTWFRPRALPLGVLGAIRMAHRFDEPALWWMTGSAGILVGLSPADWPVQLELRSEFLLQRFQARAREAGSDARDQDGAWRLGGAWGLEASRSLGEDFSLFAGLEASFLRPSIRVDVRGEEVGEEPSLGWGGLLGLRWTP